MNNPAARHSTHVPVNVWSCGTGNSLDLAISLLINYVYIIRNEINMCDEP